MSNKQHKPHAVVVLPPGRNGRITDRSLRRWLSRGVINVDDEQVELLHTVVQAIGHSAENEGLAALRFWGQTNERSTAWMAAADPVHLEARLDHLCLHSLVGAVPMTDLRPLFDFLQGAVGSEQFAFARIGQHTYLRSDESFGSARLSSSLISGLPPDEFMPTGKDAESCNKLLSEVQMALHDHEVNEHRECLGQSPVNSLWVWGGGIAPELSEQSIMPLFSDDPLFRGFWLSRSGRVESWSGDFSDCQQHAERGFVAVLPLRFNGGEPEAPDEYLLQLRELLHRQQLSSLTLIFRDGLQIDISATDRFRFWRAEAPELMPQADANAN